MPYRRYHTREMIRESSPAINLVFSRDSEDFTTYVITHNEIDSSEQIRFTSVNPAELLEKLKSENGKDIWICGGANLVQQLMRDNLIDQYYISVIPTLLGSGIRLFENVEREIKLKLLKTQTYNGITDLVYTRR